MIVDSREDHLALHRNWQSEGLNENNLPVWLQQAGYNTYYVGKYLNGHTLDNYNKPLAKGFTGSEFLLDPSTYQYYNASMSRNGGIPVNYPGQYSNDLVANKAYDFLDDAIAAGKPFFLGIAPIGPHSEFQFATLEASAPQYPPRHANLFNTITVPRTPNFNPSTPGGTSWISTLPPLTPEALAYGDTFYRARLRSLQSIDEMIESLTLRLNTKKLLENTYIIYTSDNGFHISQHRLPPGKNCGFEEDINIPLLIRGPGVSKGVSTQKVSSHTDIAPTIMSLALGKNGLDGHGFDGKPISLDIKEEGGSDSVNIEYWGRALPEGDFAAQLFYGNNTYKAADPYQLTNLALPIPSPNPVPSPSSTPRTPSPPS
ncbi:putative Arylsulfatase [Glarea lozoyensis 74030]|uniref:Putative Arylsulfatase n=1 Tax=Glarea lozoyensis (strain ATCC 74030 / MF5533) TaxID=1104152 RepID=H0EE57_GLAL7|nr:putative Arylsulfatase [Glarea lozoyensis 74030]